MSSRAKVRAHKGTRNGKTYAVNAHTRQTTGAHERFKLRPRRALANAKKSHRAAKKGRKSAAVLFGAAAVSEILGFTVLKGVGGLLVVVGVVFAAAGYGMRHRT